MKCLRWFGLILLVWVVAARAAPARAQGGTPEPWAEVDLGRFVLLCVPAEGAVCEAVAQAHGSTLNSAYDQFAGLYGQSPPLPLNVRVYSSLSQFVTLNPIQPPLTAGHHTHLGSREIALIQPFPLDFYTSEAAANSLRYELNGLFVAWLSSNQIPAALEVGLNQYAQMPGPQTQDAVAIVQAAQQAGALLPWSELFEGDRVYRNRVVAFPQALSIVAFLIDQHGFETMVRVVEATASGASYRSAFAEIYGRPVDQLEQEWLGYLPVYIEGRWQHHVLYNYDLGPFEAGLEAGAYAQVARALEEVIPFLEQTGQTEAVTEAQAIREVAEQGMQAEQLLAAYQDAMRTSDYSRALELATQAQAAFAELGDSPRVHGIEAHINHLQHVLGLRDDLASAQALAEAGNYAAAQAQLIELAPQLQAAGDLAGYQQAMDTLEALHSQQVAAARETANMARLLLLSAAALGGLIVLVHLLFMLRRTPRPESRIL